VYDPDCDPVPDHARNLDPVRDHAHNPDPDTVRECDPDSVRECDRDPDTVRECDRDRVLCLLVLISYPLKGRATSYPVALVSTPCGFHQRTR